MVLNALDTPSKESWTLVKFVNEITGGVIGAVTDRDSSFYFEGTTYESVPEMEIKLPDNNGMLTESPLNLVLPLRLAFVTRLSSGIPSPRTRVEVIEFTRSDDAAASVLRPFRGRLMVARRNAGGKREFVSMSCLSVKALLQSILLGEPCTHQCLNALGDAAYGGRCNVSLTAPPNRLVVPVGTIDGTKMVISTGVPTGLVDRFYQRGYALFDGTNVGIQFWRNEIEGNRFEFFMVRRVPAEWLGQNVTIFAGCDKTIETCRARFNREQDFNGRGYAMPAYNPLLEDGASRQ